MPMARSQNGSPRAHGRFLAAEVGELAGVSGTTIGQWARRGYIRPSVSGELPHVYSVEDVAEAAIVGELLDRGVPPRRRAPRDRPARRRVRPLAAERGRARHGAGARRGRASCCASATGSTRSRRAAGSAWRRRPPSRRAMRLGRLKSTGLASDDHPSSLTALHVALACARRRRWVHRAATSIVGRLDRTVLGEFLGIGGERTKRLAEAIASLADPRPFLVFTAALCGTALLRRTPGRATRRGALVRRRDDHHAGAQDAARRTAPRSRAGRAAALRSVLASGHGRPRCRWRCSSSASARAWSAHRGDGGRRVRRGRANIPPGRRTAATRRRHRR